MITFKKFNLADFSDSLVVTDENVARICGINGDNVFVLPSGEQTKCFARLEELCKWFLSKNLHRNGKVVAVGGGVVGDLCGFAASVYMRGVALTHVPTTLIAQIDSAIGGKTAIDLDGVKNVVGSFYSADTQIDIDFLQTLPSDQMLNGQGELLKYRMLSGKIDSLCSLSEQISECVRYKLQLCKEDPLDKGKRHLLNLGHTIGHALELYYGIPHGIAVANGIFYETELAYCLGRCGLDYKTKWQNEVQKTFPVYSLTEQVLNLTVHDKKNCNQSICFVLPSENGATIFDIALEDVFASLLQNK